jgi:polyisoprenoid-binding protein YceI
MSTALAHETRTLPSGTWRSDGIHSAVGFAVRHMVVSTFRGELPEFDVTLVAGDGEPRLEGSAPVAAITTKDPNLTAHLAAPDFFDAERHPEVRFASTAIELRPDGELIVEGELTIKGITRPVVLLGALEGPAEDPFGGSRIGLSLEGTVDRREFDLNWNMPLPGGGLAVGNEVRLVAQVELVREG